jgi:signal transduction histidine kinase
VAEPESTLREARAREVRHEVVTQLTLSTHRTFQLLFGLQCVASFVLAWKGALPGDSRVTITLLAAATLTIPTLLFVYAAQQSQWIKHWVAIAQVGWSMLFMWLLAGRAEAQFHLFVSLAMLSFYRDWRVLATATLAAFAYPLLRIQLLPASYIVGSSAWMRLLEQGSWIIAEALLLLLAIRQSLQIVARFAANAAQLHVANAASARAVEEQAAELAYSREQSRLISEATRAIPFELELAKGRFSYVGPQAEKLLGIPAARWAEPGFIDELLPRGREPAARHALDDAAPGPLETSCSVVGDDERTVDLRWIMSCELRGDLRVLRGFMIDVTGTRRPTRDSSQEQKLESVGRIAAGVAHEINTSVQFISDSVRFVRHALRDVPHALADYRALAAGVLSGRDVTAAAKKANETDEAADVDYFLKNAPDALDRALEGIDRVGSIVKSMTEFAHPDARNETDVDVNRAVTTTLNMARNEYKSVAELETDFGALPPVHCHAGDVNQVVLNLVLNAAHAIHDVVAGTSRKGRITVRTRAIGGYVEISISDTGNGIPESVRGRIFEPFVTTKEVGRGAGQGLALSRGIVVEKLKGSLHFETETGKGTTFFVRLPVSSTRQAAA